MRILACSTGFLPAESFGGLPFSTYHLCRGLANAGADVRVVTTDRNGTSRLDVPTDCWASYDGIPVWYAATRAGPYLYGASASAAIAESMREADCVISSGTLWSHSGLLAWRAAQRSRTPSLNYVRGLLDPWAFSYKRVRKRVYWHLVASRILRDSSVVVALSEAEKDIIRRLNVTTKIEVIPNGAALDGDGEPRASLDTRYPELAGRRYVLFLGRIHAKKGLDLLLQATAELRASGDDLALVIAGPVDPAYASRWEALRRAYTLDGALVAPGPVQGRLKTTLLTHAELFVLPSYGEGLPVAVLEALLAGCPVVVTRPCNLPEIEQAAAGIVIDATPEQLRTAMRRILVDPVTRDQMGRHARALARERFDWQAIAERTLSLCRELIGSRAASGSLP